MNIFETFEQTAVVHNKIDFLSILTTTNKLNDDNVSIIFLSYHVNEVILKIDKSPSIISKI